MSICLFKAQGADDMTHVAGLYKGKKVPNIST